MKRKIEKQRLHIAELEESAVPEDLEVERIRLEHLENTLRDAINRIPDEYIKKIIHLRIEKNKSWKWIAMKQGGNNTDDCIKKMCYRYFWKC